MTIKSIAPGSVVLHRDRGYGVITTVNLLTGWISVRFSGDMRPTDIDLCGDDLSYDDGRRISFRKTPPDRMPHARLMSMVRELHKAGYQRLYLYSWPKPSGLHWRWHLFCGQRTWTDRHHREGWYGSGADYNFNPVMGWGDQPGASTAQLIDALARFDPHGLAMALGRDEDHTAWFAHACDLLLPDYAFSLGWDGYTPGQGHQARSIYLQRMMPPSVPVMPVRRNGKPYGGPPLPWPPGWKYLWRHVELAPPDTSQSLWLPGRTSLTD